MKKMFEILKVVIETYIEKRPQFLKVKHSRQAKLTIATANKALRSIKSRLKKQISLTEVNKIFYVIASAVSGTLGIKPKIRVCNKLEQPKS